MKLQKRTWPGVLLLLAAASAACGDPETNDNRGYTKAPLENPNVFIAGEEPGEMAQYGAPNRVVAERIDLPAPVAATTAPPVPTTATVALPEGVTQDMVAAGDEIFNSGSTCFTCHGAGGAGGPLAPTLNDADWIHVDGGYDAIVAIIDAGVPTPLQFPAPMPPRGGSVLSDEQVRQLAAYVFAISR
ncbi:MAG: cytochrome c [Gemmatimonadota bacterium]